MNEIFGEGAVLVLIVNCILYLRSFKHYGKAFKIVSIYILATLLVEMIMRVLARYGYNNLFVSHFYCTSQLLLLSLFYINILKNKTQIKAIKIYLVLCFIMLGIQYALIPKMFFKFNLFEIFITSFPIGIMVYTTGSTIIFLSGNIINIYSPKLASDCWTFNSILYLFYQVLLFIEWKKNYSKIN
jgi:hypothetical protein